MVLDSGSAEPSGGRPIVLVVDDTPAEIRVLGNMLMAHHYDVRFALNGADAMAAVRDQRPDIVMLDIQMPAPDGYEVCRLIKSHEATASIPIIFISSLDQALDKVQAFEAGGADYVDKPFQVEEVLARMRHQLRITRLQKEMADANRKLKELEQLKAMFAAMLIHDLRSPLAVISTTLHFLRGDQRLAGSEDETLIELSATSMTKVLDLINDVLAIYRSDARDPGLVLERTELGPLLTKCGQEARVQGLAHQISVETIIEPGLPAVMASGSKLDRVVANLLANALKFSPNGGAVQLRARLVPGGRGEADPGQIEIVVADHGSGIPEEDLPFVFEPYRQAASARSLGVGLGLTIAKRFVEMHGGTLGVESRVGVGTTFTIRLSTRAP